MTWTQGAPPVLSIVAPIFNEEPHIAEFVDRCVAAAQGCPTSGFEIILVDDGSRDRSRAIIRTKMREVPAVLKLVELSRNFGQQSAFHAGLSLARGDLVVTLDSDLQDPPEIIPRLVEKMSEGVDVAYARRVSEGGGSWRASGHTGLKALGAFLFHQLASRTKNHPIPRDVGEYRCMSRRVVAHVLEFSETSIFLPGLVPYVGFREAFVEYVRQRRRNRAPTSMRRLSGRALDALTTFSVAPMTFILGLAAAAWLAPVGILAWIVGGWMGWGRPPSAAAIGWLAGAVAWCVTMSLLAIIAHYLGRVFIEVKRRPRYFIRRVLEKATDEDAGC